MRSHSCSTAGTPCGTCVEPHLTWKEPREQGARAVESCSRGGEVPRPEPPEELQAKALADAYRDLCAANETFAKETMAEAVRLGDDLIELLGGWLRAVKAYRASWTERFGNNLQGIFGPRLDGLVGPEILQYVRHVAKHGPPRASRRPRGGSGPSRTTRSSSTWTRPSNRCGRTATTAGSSSAPIACSISSTTSLGPPSGAW